MKLPWSEAAGAEFGADWLLSATEPVSAYGRSARERERVFGPGDDDDALRRMRSAGAVAASYSPEMLSAIGASLRTIPDVRSIVTRARSGEVLSDDDFFELGAFADALVHIGRVRGGDFAEAVGPWEGGAQLASLLAPGRGPGSTFYLADAFDDALAAERKRAVETQAAYDLARGQSRDAVARALGVESVRDGEFTLARDAVRALPENVRVVREGATYFLCRVEPGEAELAALAERDATATAVAEAEEAVRASLSASVRDGSDVLDEVCDMVGGFDTLIARASFTQRYSCVVPRLGASSIALDGMRFLPLETELAGLGRAYTPLSFALDGMAVITGPNMGGKTAALRTLGFAGACVALGIPLPARSASMQLFDEVAWLGLGAAHEPALLSSFGREVVEAREFLAGGARRALVLVDEFARTTAPREGSALTVAFLEALRARGAMGLVATHLDGVAAAAGVTHLATAGVDAGALGEWSDDLATALSRIGAAMDYRVVPVAAGAEPPSNALALAGALGLPPALLERARALFAQAL